MMHPSEMLAEARRWELLKDYYVPDTDADHAFDELVRLAARTCDVPSAYVSTFDATHEWCRAATGWTLVEIPHTNSFGVHVVAGEEPLVVADTLLDSRFAENPMVTGEPCIRFYAGAPLRNAEGIAFGTLSVADRVPREPTAAHVESLGTIARQVAMQLELRRQRRALNEGEGILLQVFQNCPVGLAIHRWRDRTFVDVNAAFTQLVGWEARELMGRTTTDIQLVDEADAARMRTALQSGATIRDFELQIRTRAGEARHILIGAEILSLRGEPHTISTFVDITARRNAEAEASLATQRLLLGTEATATAIWDWDLVHDRWYASPTFATTFGYAVDASLTDRHVWLERTHPDDRAAVAAIMEGALAGGTSPHEYESRIRHADGSYRWVRVIARPLGVEEHGKATRLIGALVDITERRETQLAAFRLAAIVASSDDAIIGKDLNGIVTSWNAGAEQIFGYTAAEMIGEPIMRLIPPDRIDEETHIITRIRRGEGTHHRDTVRRRKDGQLIHVAVTANPIRDAQGKIIGASKLARDVTEQHRIEARFRRLVESDVQGVMFYDMDGGITAANDAFLAMVGYSREELMAEPLQWSTLTPPEHRAADARAIAQLETRGVCPPYEKEFFRKDGSRVPVLIGAAQFEDNSREGVCFVLDLTERKKLEVQFLRAQRMEGIGTLAGGIAHDLNNVLAPIMLAVEMLRDSVKDEEGQAILGTLQTSARHGADLVRQVLAFARGVSSTNTTVNPLGLARDLVKVLRDTFPRSINIELVAPPDLWTAAGDPTHVRQVLLNLCVNARDAMPEGGELVITMSNVVLDTTYTGMNLDAHPGPYVLISVADNGSGIPPEIQERIFDPFFTTKETGRGTGLGLSTTLAIMKGVGGFIHLYSEAGKGTEFKVYLRAQTTVAAAEDVAVEQTRLPRGSGELILVVDDEESIRTVVRGTLERFGYRVLLAQNGAEAVGTYANRRREIDVVLTDMAMPLMDGAATILALRAINPSVTIVASSGLTSEASMSSVMGMGATHFAPKPYTAETLLKTIKRAVLDSKAVDDSTA